MKLASQFRSDSVFPQDIVSRHQADSTKEISTETKSFPTLEKKKPDPGRSGLDTSDDEYTTPFIIAYPELNASGNLVCAEKAMSYTPGGFVKIPRSLFAHPGFMRARVKHRYIFLEMLVRATWAPSFFYWNGTRIDLSIGQLYFSRNGLAKELSTSKQCDDKITEADIRGSLRYFSKIKFLTSALTSALTNGPTIVTILYKEFCDEEISSHNQTSNQRPNQRLTSASPTKEEDKEHKEEKENKKKKPTTASRLVDNADALRLCSKFIQILGKTLPDLKLPSSTAKWELEFDRMLRIDGRSILDVESVLEKMPGHWYSKNVQSAAKFREKFAQIKAHVTEQKGQSDASVNRALFLEAKREYPKELRDWTASGDWVINSRNSKEISLKMLPDAFKSAFLSACGGTEIV